MTACGGRGCLPRAWVDRLAAVEPAAMDEIASGDVDDSYLDEKGTSDLLLIASQSAAGGF